MTPAHSQLDKDKEQEGTENPSMLLPLFTDVPGIPRPWALLYSGQVVLFIVEARELAVASWTCRKTPEQGSSLKEKI